MLLPLSPDTVRNFLPQGARLILTSKHSHSIMVASLRVNMADSMGVSIWVDMPEFIPTLRSLPDRQCLQGA